MNLSQSFIKAESMPRTSEQSFVSINCFHSENTDYTLGYEYVNLVFIKDCECVERCPQRLL
jgi:hypothetical protein